MKTGNYTCALCEKEFEPTKREVQKFCSRKCGQKHNYHKNKSDKELGKKPYKEFSASAKEEKEEGILPSMLKTAGGVLIADGIKHVGNKILGNPNDELATKGDIIELTKSLGDGDRYRAIKNYKLGPNGEPHYFDLETNEIIYFPKKIHQNTTKNHYNNADNVI